MKTVIVYASTHHGNTKKLVDAISSRYDVKTIDCTTQKEADLNEYDLIGLASGVACGRYYPAIIKFIKNNLPEGKKVFFLHTAGGPKEEQNRSALSICKQKNCKNLGTYCCKGFDTFGPLKLFGGTNKENPTKEEIASAVQFYENIANS